ncbi:MAG TPA: DNA recombination protein RmuC [Dehalococcoidales bacterium]|nr:DNA recombination protein RmuC [Dehalococcoidales bacterium]
MTEIVIIALLVILIGFFLWDRLRGRQRLKEQGDALSRIVGEKVEGSIAVFGDVRERLGELTQRARDIQEVGKNVSSLQELLRAPKFRGGFGELLLERLLADILPADSYSRQYRFKDGQIVDAVVRVGKNLVPIDSKFPTSDFEQITKAESEEEQKNLRRQFTRSLKKHIDEVTKYILPDENTFDFALMYIPAENIYYETIIRGSGEDDILSYSLDRRVVPVSPNSFYAYLQVIVQGLRGLQFEKAAGEILSYVRRLQGDLNSFEDDFDKLGGHIRHAANKYDEASRKLARFEDKLQLTGGVSMEKLPEGDSKKHEDEK